MPLGVGIGSPAVRFRLRHPVGSSAACMDRELPAIARNLFGMLKRRALTSDRKDIPPPRFDRNRLALLRSGSLRHLPVGRSPSGSTGQEYRPRAGHPDLGFPPLASPSCLLSAWRGCCRWRTWPKVALVARPARERVASPSMFARKPRPGPAGGSAHCNSEPSRPCRHHVACPPAAEASRKSPVRNKRQSRNTRCPGRFPKPITWKAGLSHEICVPPRVSRLIQLNAST